jgi:hypothetical protein
MYLMLGIAVTLAVLLLLTFALKLLAHLLFMAVRRTAAGWSPKRRSDLFFALMSLPSAAALVVVVTLVVPSYAVWEPHVHVEVPSWNLLVMAAVCLSGLALSLRQSLQRWWKTQVTVHGWSDTSRPLELPGVDLPARALRADDPIVALVGVRRPRVFVADCVLKTLNPEELKAAIEHELGHQRANDNHKRWLQCFLPDVLNGWWPAGNSIAKSWEHACELSADDFVAQSGRSSSLALASALVKVAKLMPQQDAPDPIGSYLLKGTASNLRERVAELMRPWQGSTAERGTLKRWKACVGLSLALLLFSVFYSSALMGTHELLEIFVHWLR